MLAALALITVLVQPGDTLSGIASSHGVSLSALEAANPQISNPDVISAGENVNLPGGSSSTPSSNSSPASASPSSSPSSSASPSGSSSTGSTGGGLSDVPGVPASFAKCVAFRESTNGQGSSNIYGIIPASGYNIIGQSLGAQKAAFGKLYAQYGNSPWTPSDGC